jgi:hypothetical protein
VTLDDELDIIAVDAVRRLKAAQRDGQAVPCIVEFELSLTLK